MSVPAPKAEQSKAPTVVDRSAPLQSSSSSNAVTVFSDNRPVAAAHRQMQAQISTSPRMQQAAAQQSLIAQSPRQQAAQLRAVTPGASGAAPAKRNTTGLPDQLKSGVENLSGYSLDDVQVHYNSAKPAQLQAHAYAQGSEIHVAPGQEHHLPHEAWHVVQQKQGRVQATSQLKGISVNDDSGLEQEADVMGEKAMDRTFNISNAQLINANVKGVIQGFFVYSDVMRFKREKKEAHEEKAHEEKKESRAVHDEVGIYLSTSFEDEGKLNTDSTNKKYRQVANDVLGGKDAINELAKKQLISAPEVSRFAFTLSHLIAAEFGGQLKYKNPSDNIRFLPAGLEYGDWQKAESDVKKHGDEGVLYVSGDDGSINTVFQMAEDLVSMIEDKYTFSQLVDIKISLWNILKGAQYVPSSINFSYIDYGSGKNVKISDSGMNEQLMVNKDADADNVIAFLKIYNILPAIDLQGRKAEDIAVTTNGRVKLTSDSDLINFIQKIAGDKKRMATILKSINNLKVNPVFDNKTTSNKIEEQLRKLPEVGKKDIAVDVSPYEGIKGKISIE